MYFERYADSEAYYRATPDGFRPEQLKQQEKEFLARGGKITYLPPCAFKNTEQMTLRQSMELEALTSMGPKYGRKDRAKWASGEIG